MNDNIFWSVIYVSMVIGLFALGWYGNILYRDMTNKRLFNGLYMRNFDNQSSAIKNAYNFDSLGEWICINTKGMTFQEILTTCTHEAAHEVFAEIIEENPEKIEEVINLVKNDTK